MSAETNYAKLGAFVLSSLLLGLGSAGYVAYRQVNREVETFVTYFDESVQGLELGSPVKFRGVTIGKVSQVRIAADRRHVELECTVEVATMRRLNLPSGGEDRPFEDLRKLRAQLVLAGITGSKFVGLDYFDPRKTPPPKLPFEVPRNYLPAAPSTFKSFQHVLSDLGDQLPGFAQDVKRLVQTVERKLDAVDTARINSATLLTLEDARGLMQSAKTRLDEVDASGISSELKQTLQEARKTLASSEGLLKRVQQKEGLLANLEGSVANVRSASQQASRVLAKAEKFDVEELNSLTKQAGKLSRELERTLGLARNTLKKIGPDASGALRSVRDSTQEVQRTLKALRLASEAVRKIADALERDSDMLLKGRYRKGR